MPSTKPSTNIRAQVVHGLQQITEQGRTLDWLLEHRSNWCETPLQRELLYGCARHYDALAATIDTYLKKPFKPKDQDIYALMIVGAYQLIFMKTPSYAAINETVNAARVLSKPWAKGLVNAVLRQIDRSIQTDELVTSGIEWAALCHPTWLSKKIQTQYPQRWQAVLLANNSRAPMTLRINTPRCSIAAYCAMLDAAGMRYQTTSLDETVTLDQPLPAEDLPGWGEGYVSVQDLGTQFAAHLLCQHLAEQSTTAVASEPGVPSDGTAADISENPKSEPLRILDACTAPGGKLFHLHERLLAKGTVHEIVAVDAIQKRLDATETIGKRLQHFNSPENADSSGNDLVGNIAKNSDLTKVGSAQTMLTISPLQLICGDASQDTLTAGGEFDAILLDAPCSGSGTLRRHPDMRLLMQPEQLTAHTELQAAMLRNLWQQLKPGGTLLYVTCSIFAEENDAVIEQFMAENSTACGLSCALPHGEATHLGWQILPSLNGPDGLYFCALYKTTQQ